MIKCYIELYNVHNYDKANQNIITIIFIMTIIKIDIHLNDIASNTYSVEERKNKITITEHLMFK